MHLQQAAMLPGAVEVVGCTAGALVAAQRGPLLPARLALDHAAPPGGIAGPLHVTAGGHVHLHPLALLEGSRHSGSWRKLLKQLQNRVIVVRTKEGLFLKENSPVPFVRKESKDHAAGELGATLSDTRDF